MLSGNLGRSLEELSYARCTSCGSLIAIDGRRDPELLAEVYRTLPDSYWSRLNPQTNFGRVIDRHLSQRRDGGDLWDIGCGSGYLLESLENRWTKHGIEPGIRAVTLANQRGLEVHAGTAGALGLNQVADAALMVDVVEHLADPVTELRAVAEMLRPGGVLIVFTGAADAWTARVAGSLWYYLHCIGHVTVFSRSGLVGMLIKLGFTNVQTHRIEHPGGVGMAEWLRRIGGNGMRRASGRPAAAMHYYRDHQLVVASKPR
ncbi:MAG TPA: class I SAM-dependent methyltransferase [Pirellulales bacterium]|jgi:SAM-dependent methyltransferase|nr:class I SAM-dependent methyltransferase [Pirellulales bacterium]